MGYYYYLLLLISPEWRGVSEYAYNISWSKTIFSLTPIMRNMSHNERFVLDAQTVWVYIDVNLK